MKKILISLLISIAAISANAITEHPDGSVTLSAKELVALQANVNSIVQQAYKAGVEDGAEAVKSNPKLCPKDI